MMHRNMTATEVLAGARRDGLLLVVAPDGGLLVTGSAVVRDCWLDALRRHKAGIVTLLRTELLQEFYQERSAVLQYDGGLPRAEAEAAARASVSLLARAAGMPWRALRQALGDDKLPDADSPVDTLPYGLPRWTTTPNGAVVPQGVHTVSSGGSRKKSASRS